MFWEIYHATVWPSLVFYHQAKLTADSIFDFLSSSSSIIFIHIQVAWHLQSLFPSSHQVVSACINNSPAQFNKPPLNDTMQYILQLMDTHLSKTEELHLPSWQCHQAHCWPATCQNADPSRHSKIRINRDGHCCSFPNNSCFTSTKAEGAPCHIVFCYVNGYPIYLPSMTSQSFIICYWVRVRCCHVIAYVF